MTVDFPVRMCVGASGCVSSGSSDTNVRGLELMIDSTSQSRVVKESKSRRLPCSYSRPESTFLTERIRRSQTPPMLLAEGGLNNQTIPYLDSISLIRSWFISSKHAFSSLSAPVKLVPLSLLISLTRPRLAMNLLSAFMNASVSNGLQCERSY